MRLNDWLKGRAFGFGKSGKEPAPEPQQQLCRDDRVSHGDILATANAPQWSVTDTTGHVVTVQARTRSEARALVKRHYGGAIPADVAIERVET